MRTFNIKFVNFWPLFDKDIFLQKWINTYKNPNIRWIYNTSLKPDIVISSIFGPLENLKDIECKKILYVRENLENEGYESFKNNLNIFDLVIGFNDISNQINVPYLYEASKYYNYNWINIDILTNIHDRKNLCLISHNPHYLRLQLLQSFNDNQYIVDCPGKVGHNLDLDIDDKIKFIQNYYFNICPENSYAKGYVTEKLCDACVAGCIPIYYGYDDIESCGYNKDRVLHIKQDLSNYNDIIEQTIYLLNHKQELIEFINQQPFIKNIDQYFIDIEKRIALSLEKFL